MQKNLKAVFAAVAASLVAPVANAQVCNTHKEIVTQLGELYGETPAFQGLSRSGHIVEVYQNTKTGSFSVLTTTPSGQSCLVDAGDVGELPKRTPYSPERGAQLSPKP